ncbi:MAG: hypothetical protein U0791_15390 [Gemmataceae bacterium]
MLIGLPPLGILLHAAATANARLEPPSTWVSAYLPNFKETDLSKIVVGFGGTVNMVTGLGYLVCVVGLMAVRSTPQLAEGLKNIVDAPLNPWVFAGLPSAWFLCAFAVVLLESRQESPGIEF